MGVPQTHGRALLYQSVRSGIEERRGTCILDPSSFILYLLLCLFLTSSLHCPLPPPPLSPRPLSRSCTAKTPHCVLRSSPRQHLLRPPSQLKKLLPPPLLLQQKHHHHRHILAKELATDHTLSPYRTSSIMGDSLVHQEYGRTRVQWLASLNTEYHPPKQFRRTSIICTIGMTPKREIEMRHITQMG